MATCVLYTRYSAEIHLVHYNMKYASLGDAVDKPDGLAVIGVLVDMDSANEKTPFISVRLLLSNIMIDSTAQS